MRTFELTKGSDKAVFVITDCDATLTEYTLTTSGWVTSAAPVTLRKRCGRGVSSDAHLVKARGWYRQLLARGYSA